MPRRLDGRTGHVLDLMFISTAMRSPERLRASSGYDDISTHPTAKSAEYRSPSGMARGVLMAGSGARLHGGPPICTSGSCLGTHGFRHWRMDAWERSLPDGAVESQTYPREEDIIGRAGLTNALRLVDRRARTTCHIPDEWLVILASYASTVEARHRTALRSAGTSSISSSALWAPHSLFAATALTKYRRGPSWARLSYRGKPERRPPDALSAESRARPRHDIS